MTRTIAALFVKTDGPYFNLPGVEAYDEARDARTAPGPHPGVAHPPCQRWGKFYAGSPLVIARTGVRKKLGDDDGCFEAAHAYVKRWGGVLEHPAGSHAWKRFGLKKPPRSGGWVVADDFGGWTCCVEQGRYGHYCRKLTWLLAYGCELPELDWGVSAPIYPEWALEKYGLEKCKKIGEMGLQGGGQNAAARIETPAPFRDILIGMARSVGQAYAMEPAE